MRATWITLVVLVVLIIAFGVYMLSVSPIVSPSTQGQKPPKAVVTETVFDFGTMGQNESGEHDFEIRNEGDGVLKLTQGAVSCKCVATVLDESVPAGGKGTFRMKWTTLTVPDPTFTQTAVVLTNDPAMAEIRFRVGGMIRPAFILEPMSLAFDDVEHGHASSLQGFEVWSPDEGLKITKWDGADHMDVKVEPMAEARLKVLKAKSGYGVSVRLKKSHPTGRLDDKSILFHTNHKTRKTFAISRHGYVVGQLSFEPRRAAFQYADSSQGKTLKVYVFFRGKKKVEFAVADVKPSFLKVAIQPAEGDASRYVITIRVPKGAPAGPFEGTVKVQTSNKDTPELVIPTTGTVMSGT